MPQGIDPLWKTSLHHFKGIHLCVSFNVQLVQMRSRVLVRSVSLFECLNPLDTCTVLPFTKKPKFLCLTSLYPISNRSPYFTTEHLDLQKGILENEGSYNEINPKKEDKPVLIKLYLNSNNSVLDTIVQHGKGWLC